MSRDVPFGRFVLRERIATGGMGEVFVAVQTGVGEFRKPLALKLMLPGFSDEPQRVAAFLAEARLAAQLHHPNVVQVFDAGCIDQRYYLSMELVDGPSLSDLIRHLSASGGSAGAEVICHIGRLSLEGLHYAHTARAEDGAPLDLVHRDVSPGNLLLSSHGEVKLADFGIARASSRESFTRPGDVKGKLDYLAPELASGAAATVQSDLFALGVTLYRLAALDSPGVPLATRRPDLPIALVSTIERALSKEPAQRFESAAAMRDALPRGDFEARQASLRTLVHEVLAQPKQASAKKPREPTASMGAAMIVEPVAAVSTASSRWWLAVPAVAIVGGLVAWQMREQPVVTAVVPVEVVAPAAEPIVETVIAEPGVELEFGELSRTASPRARTPRGDRAKLSKPALLTVQALPWAMIEVDGKVVGQTPLAGFPIESEHPVIRLTNPEFRTVELKPTLKAGETFKISRTLEKR